MNTQQQVHELESRPDINQIMANYTDMRDKLAQRLTAELDMGDWQDLHDGRESGCANEFPNVDRYDVVRHNLDRLSNDRSISTEQWPKAVEIISNVASTYGFNRTGPRVDKPPSHYITILDQYGAELFVGTEQQTVISVTTGCHLTPQAKARGTTGTTATP